MEDYRSLDNAIDKGLREALAAYDAAADKFIGKVDRGEARSIVTYRELKAAKALSLKARTMFGLKSYD